MEKNFNKSKGRPSRSKQHQMEEMLLPYFKLGITAFSLSKIPNMPNIKTITRYYNKFEKILDEQLGHDLEKAQRNAKGRFLFATDENMFIVKSQIDELRQYKKDRRSHYDRKVSQMIEQGREQEIVPYKPDLQAEKLLHQLNQYMVELIDAKAAIEARSTAFQETEDYILEELEKKAQRAEKARKKLEEEENKIRQLHLRADNRRFEN